MNTLIESESGPTVLFRPLEVPLTNQRSRGHVYCSGLFPAVDVIYPGKSLP